MKTLAKRRGTDGSIVIGGGDSSTDASESPPVDGPVPANRKMAVGGRGGGEILCVPDAHP